MARRKALSSTRSEGRAKKKARTIKITDLEVIGDKQVRLNESWPIPSKLQSAEFQQEMKLCGINYKMNDKREVCGIMLNFHNGMRSK